MKKMSRMHNPPHPGVYVKDLLDQAGLNQEQGADHIGISRPQLNLVINGKAGVETELAVRLALVFGTTAEVWLNMQMLWNLWQFDQQKKSLKVKPIKHKAA